MSVALLLRPELEHQRYRLTVRFTLDAPLRGIKTEAWKDYARRELKAVYERWIRDMERQGWRHVSGTMPVLKGPFSHIEPRGIPKRPNVPKRQPGQPSIPLHKVDRVDRDYYQQDVRPVSQHEQWDYECVDVFTKRMLVEVPDVGPKSELTLDEYLKRSA